jgi:triacylglycerol lipase
MSLNPAPRSPLMPLQKKPLPRPSFSLVLHPESDRTYKHFEGSGEVPFEITTTTTSTMSRANAWWLADASLLTYWDEAQAKTRFAPAGLDSRLIGNEENDTQCYLAWSNTFTIVAFRGTQADRLQDLITDATLGLVDWDRQPGEHVHLGFLRALDAVWPEIVKADELKKRPVWFTGHSLGAALATLAGDRFSRERSTLGLGELGGIYGFGSPLVGDRQFVDGFNRRCGDRSFRFVNDQDAVTRVPPPLLGYRHVNTERFVGFDDPDVTFISEPLIDHTPRRYAVLAWNALVESV